MVMEWYSWVGLILIPVVIGGYLFWKKQKYS